MNNETNSKYSVEIARARRGLEQEPEFESYVERSRRNREERERKRKEERKRKLLTLLSKGKRVILKNGKFVVAGSLLLSTLFYGMSLLNKPETPVVDNVGPTITATQIPTATPTPTPEKITEVIEHNEIEESDFEIDKELEESFLDYRNYCYEKNYKGKDYLFVSKEKALEMSEYAINKINKIFKENGMPTFENGECVPEVVNPELITSILLKESDGRVETLDGRTLIPDCYSEMGENTARGPIQQTPVWVQTVSGFSERFGGESYTEEDSENPYKAIEMAVIGFTRTTYAYFRQNSSEANNMYKELGLTSQNDDRVRSALIISYNQGEGNMKKFIENGSFQDVISNPDATKFGGDYFWKTMGHYQNVKSVYSQMKEDVPEM